MPQLPEMASVEQWNILLMTAATCLWFFAVGTAFGSFLNVVVYRMPRGLPVGGSSSHCPGCSRAIPWHDNVPILGYLRLRGRCQCRANPISPRYPIVETIVGLLVLALLFGELLSAGANLPLRVLDGRTGVVWVIWSLQWDLIGTFLYHATLLYVLFGLTLIDLDGFRPPAGWLVFGLIVGLIAPAVAPFLHSVPLAGVGDGPFRDVVTTREALARASVGGAAGILLGLILAWVWRRDPRKPNAAAHQVAAMLLVGTYLGWQAAFSIALASALVFVVLRRAAFDEPALAGLPPSLPVWVLTLGQILLWRFITLYLPVWPGPFTVLPALIGSGLALLAAAFIGARLVPPPPPESEAPAPFEPISIQLPEPADTRPGEPLG